MRGSLEESFFTELNSSPLPGQITADLFNLFKAETQQDHVSAAWGWPVMSWLRGIGWGRERFKAGSCSPTGLQVSLRSSILPSTIGREHLSKGGAWNWSTGWLSEAQGCLVGNVQHTGAFEPRVECQRLSSPLTLHPNALLATQRKKSTSWGCVSSCHCCLS